MTDLSAHTLMVAIKAVDREGSRLQSACNNLDDEDPELEILEEELLDVSKAETELQKAYEAIQKASDNLPLYKRLIDG